MAYPVQQPFAAGQKQILNTVHLTPTSIGGTTFSIQTFTINTLDPISHQFPQLSNLANVSGSYTQTSGIVVLSCWVSAANTLSVLFYNTTGGSLTPSDGYYSLCVH